MKLRRPDYNQSILNVSNTFLHHYGVETEYKGIKELEDKLQSNTYNHIIYILLDGMGANIVNKHLTKEDALRKYMVKPITSVFPPTTVAATNSVLSGLPPISTGYLGWVQYFEEEQSDVAVFLNRDFYDASITFDHIVREKYLSYDNILVRSKAVNKDLHTSIIFPEYIEQGTAKSFDHGIEQVLMKTHNTDESFTYLYWVQPDLIEHQKGIYSDEVRDMLQSLNKSFESLIENITDDTLVVCIADHGLTDVEEINLFKYENIVKMLERKPSIEPRAINFFVKDEYKDAFPIEFNKEFKDIYNLFTKEDLLKAELFGKGVQHPCVDMFLGDYLAIAVDKYMLGINDKKIYKAHHAGLTEDEMMVPLIIYSKK